MKSKRKNMNHPHYEGVFHAKGENPWKAVWINENGHKVVLGYYLTAQEAHAVWKRRVAKDGQHMATPSKSITPNAKLPFRAVVWDKVLKKAVHLGCYATAEEAQEAKDKRINLAQQKANVIAPRDIPPGVQITKSRVNPYRVVAFDKDRNISVHLGCYATAEEAHEAFKQKRNLSEDNPNKMKGVYKTGSSKKPYRASANINGKTKHLGCFATPEEAHQAYLQAITQ